jgi:lipocalin
MKNELNHEGGKSINIETVDKFDLSRYLGVWHEIARYDHRFERGLSQVKAEYILQENGMIKVINTGLDAKSGKRNEVIGKAKTTEKPGLLRVSFFWIFYSDYRVLRLGDNYEWALVSAGHSDKYLWILSRTEKLPQDVLDAILSEARERGFDTEKLIFN